MKYIHLRKNTHTYQNKKTKLSAARQGNKVGFETGSKQCVNLKINAYRMVNRAGSFSSVSVTGLYINYTQIYNETVRTLIYRATICIWHAHGFICKNSFIYIKQYIHTFVMIIRMLS